MDTDFHPANADIARMLVRLATHGEITPEKVEALARANHQATPVAGTPVPWDEDGEIVAGVRWDEAGRQRKRAAARSAMEMVRARAGRL